MNLNLAQKAFRSSSTVISRRMLAVAGITLIALAAVACGTDSGTSVGSSLDVTDTPVPPKKAGPSFAVETFNHGPYDLDESIGRPVLINFWFPSCPPCRAELPELQAAYEEYGTEIDFIGVEQTGVDTAQDGIDYLAELGVTYPNFADNGDSTETLVQFDYKVLNYPTTVFLDRDHKINRTWTGIIDEANLREQIRAVIES